VTPPEVERGLRKSAAAWKAFCALPPSRRKQYVAFLASAKKPETQTRRFGKAIDMLERGEHPMDKYRKKQ
jgi:uncharacterized protein YdeI (YjbR/CyaY-like superfamily)